MKGCWQKIDPRSGVSAERRIIAQTFRISRGPFSHPELKDTGGGFEAWSLEFLWMLDVGCWMFRRRNKNIHLRPRAT